MSFISENQTVEDGTGLPAAVSYISGEDARKYLSLQNRDGEGLFSLTDNQIFGFLVQGTIYIDTNFQFLGEKVNPLQALSFPRSGIEGESQTFPDAVKYATVETAALIQKNSVYYDPGSKDTHVTEQKVGPITTKYMESSDRTEARDSSQIDRLEFVRGLLSKLTIGGGRLSPPAAAIGSMERS